MKEVSIQLENVTKYYINNYSSYYSAQEHKKQMEAAMENLEAVQNSHQKEITQIQDISNQQSINRLS